MSHVWSTRRIKLFVYQQGSVGRAPLMKSAIPPKHVYGFDVTTSPFLSGTVMPQLTRYCRSTP
ncbi:hypothetical protein KIN20_027712 [Parelaphostrongylus tenuis]|uniref:Uncharacterized protein n=1 Tax=Parelaphostrongylus tenuis TaxID=148309 RepID=A0AAD5R0E5_PARTN|nr:hypothetical protein KIN20_027712 [Parelaphostrongylus tenuis]